MKEMEEDAKVMSEESQKREREIGQSVHGGAQDTSVQYILKKHLSHTSYCTSTESSSPVRILEKIKTAWNVKIRA